MTTLEIPALRDELHAAGLKATPQRIEVLKILRRSNQHLDAEGIHQAALQRGAEISLATVYRTLGALERVGLVEQRSLARDHSRDHFEAADRPEHYHFTCLVCEGVFEFESRQIKQLKRELRDTYGWDLTEADLYFEGICDRCAREGKNR